MRAINVARAMAIAKEYSCAEYEAELVWLAEQASTRKRIVEIGSWVGRTCRAMADNTFGQVYAVDTWEGTLSEPETMEIVHRNSKEWLLDSFLKNTQDLQNVVPVQMDSLTAAELFKGEPKFDMIFIDGDHEYECVKADILAWQPLLSEGGLFCGHDLQLRGVERAVKELIPNFKNPQGVIWTA